LVFKFLNVLSDWIVCFLQTRKFDAAQVSARFLVKILIASQRTHERDLVFGEQEKSVLFRQPSRFGEVGYVGERKADRGGKAATPAQQ